MSTYVVTDTPSQPGLPGQGILSLTNLGPSTIYLEADTAVSVLNGMALPPMGQMTWDGSKPLFAVCASGGSATLQINNTAGAINANRARFWALLYQLSGQFLQYTPSIEVGHCETIVIKIQYLPNTLWSAGVPIQLDLNWQDALGNTIHWDFVYVNPISNNSPSSELIVRVPVVGTFLSIGNFYSTGVTLLQVFGSDRVLPFRSYSRPSGNNNVPNQTLRPTVCSAPTTFTSFDSTDDAFWFTGWTTYNDLLLLANMGQRLTLGINSSGITSAGNLVLEIFSDTVSQNYLFIPIAVGTANQQVSTPVPYGSCYRLKTTGPLVGGLLRISGVWTDD